MSDAYQLRKDIDRLSTNIRFEVFDIVYPIGSIFFNDIKPQIGEWELVTDSFEITEYDYIRVWRRIE